MSYPPQPGAPQPQYPYYGQPYQHPYPTDPADAPTYGISFGRALVNFFKKYAQFTGRASLSEYWWMYLWNALLGVVVGVIVMATVFPAMFDTIRTAALASSGAEITQAEVQRLVFQILGAIVPLWVVLGIIGLALLVPYLAITVRRLHDSDKSGHFAWLMLVPSVGQLIVLILCLMPTNPYGQRFDRPLQQQAPGH